MDPYQQQRYHDLLGILEDWESSAELTTEKAERVRDTLELLLRDQLREVRELLEQPRLFSC
jgi:hypothetical protein